MLRNSSNLHIVTYVAWLDYAYLVMILIVFIHIMAWCNTRIVILDNLHGSNCLALHNFQPPCYILSFVSWWLYCQKGENIGEKVSFGSFGSVWGKLALSFTPCVYMVISINFFSWTMYDFQTNSTYAFSGFVNILIKGEIERPCGGVPMFVMSNWRSV